MPVRLSALRPRDFLVLEFELVNLRVEEGPGGVGRLAREQAGDAFVSVHFPPQHVAEEVNAANAGKILAGAHLSGTSRLVFRVPEGVKDMPCTLDALLDWEHLEPALAPTALPRAVRLEDLPAERPRPAAPGLTETAIEGVCGLVLSPDAAARWSHTPLPSANPEAVALWHTSLGVKDEGSDPVTRPDVRAIWERQDPQAVALETSLSSGDRRNLVEQTANYDVRLPSPVTAKQLRMTSLGAWLDLFGRWEGEPPLPLESWLHRSTMGRDQAVTVVEPGFLCPFGHRAAKVTSTRRRFLPHAPGAPEAVAVLVKETFIVVMEQERSYDGLTDKEKHAIPFRHVSILTKTSPPIMAHIWEGHPFWPQKLVDFKYVQFGLAAQDWDLSWSGFVAPLMFVPKGAIGNFPEVRNRFTEVPSWSLKCNGQLVAYASSVDQASPDKGLAELGRVAFATEEMWLTAEDTSLPFVPRMSKARVHIRALDHLKGNQNPVTVTYNKVYVKSGFGPANVAQVVLDVDGMTPLDLLTDRAGGVGVPRFSIDAVSREYGPMGAARDANNNAEPDKLARGQLPDYLDKVLGNSRILGVIPLRSLIPKGADSLQQVPTILSTSLPGGVLESTLRWEVQLRPDVKNNKPAFLRLSAVVKGGTGASSYLVKGSLQNFRLELLPKIQVLSVLFSSITFEQGTSSETKTNFSAIVDSDANAVEFHGPLEFLQRFQEILGKSLAGGPRIDVAPQGVRVSYGLGVPNLDVGIMSLHGIAVSAALELPFGADIGARFRFAFCERHQPFLVTVALFGGGGFVAIELTPDGIALLEAALEFGGAIVLDLGVASGAVLVMAGIYFHLDPNVGVELTGYYRVGGALEVLSLIRLSIEFYLGLTWNNATSKASGTARVVVEVEVAVFSDTVTLEVRREFSGSPNDPLFEDLVSPDDWKQYQAAFV